jgi:hypothetical protein
MKLTKPETQALRELLAEWPRIRHDVRHHGAMWEACQVPECIEAGNGGDTFDMDAYRERIQKLMAQS